MTEDLQEEILARIIEPTITAMAAQGHPYKGVLFAGIIITDDGPKLLEYNVRFGDPETQVLIMRLMSDLLPALIASRDGVLEKFHLRWYPETALTVVMAAQGYPGPYAKNSEIKGLENLTKNNDLKVFHAGTIRANNGTLRSTGGRVLNVTAMGATVAEAQHTAYDAISKIDWPDGFCRSDIGWRAVGR
jgi:phosphoribosylamine--glycine ligase